MTQPDEAAREELLSEISHRLRTPLAVITGYAELLERREGEETRREATARIIDAAARLSAGIDEALARFESLSLPDEAGTPATESVTPTAARRVLLVDDEENVRRLLRATFPGDAFDIVEAPDGEAAIATLDDAHPELVLLDWHLPGVSGAQTLQALKRREPSLGVIVLTADGDPKSRETAVELGADGFLTKPFSPLQLLAECERLLGGRAAA